MPRHGAGRAEFPQSAIFQSVITRHRKNPPVWAVAGVDRGAGQVVLGPLQTTMNRSLKYTGFAGVALAAGLGIFALGRLTRPDGQASANSTTIGTAPGAGSVGATPTPAAAGTAATGGQAAKPARRSGALPGFALRQAGGEDEGGKPAEPITSFAKKAAAPATPDIVATNLREIKPVGSTYACTFLYGISGQGKKPGWIITGSAHFEVLQEIRWTETIEENDGERLVVLRDFESARKLCLVSDAQIGVSELIVGLLPKDGKTLTASELAETALINPFLGMGMGATLLPSAIEDEALRKYPVVSLLLQYWADQKAGEAAKKIQVFQDTLAGLHGNRVRLTFEKGKLASAAYTDGAPVDATVKKWATRMSPYLDYRLVPENPLPVGVEEDKSVNDLASLLNIENEPDQAMEGVVRLKRLADPVAGEIALFEGLGFATFDGAIEGGRLTATGELNLIKFKYAYGKAGKYIAECQAETKKSQLKHSEDGLLWGRNDRLTAAPSIYIRYACTPTTGFKE